jgi:hypothetical protein
MIEAQLAEQEAAVFAKTRALIEASQALCFDWNNPNLDDTTSIAERFNALNDATNALIAALKGESK